MDNRLFSWYTPEIIADMAWQSNSTKWFTFLVFVVIELSRTARNLIISVLQTSLGNKKGFPAVPTAGFARVLLWDICLADLLTVYDLWATHVTSFHMELASKPQLKQRLIPDIANVANAVQCSQAKLLKLHIYSRVMSWTTVFQFMKTLITLKSSIFWKSWGLWRMFKWSLSSWLSWRP